MKYRKIMFMLVLAIFIFGAASVCASDMNDTVIASEDTGQTELSAGNENEIVEQASNEEVISEANAGTFQELQQNITQGYGSYITLDKDYEYEDGFSTDGITITQSIIIDGQGHKIDAKGKARIFNIKTDNVILQNITFMNGKSTDGGAIKWEANRGSVLNCHFENNTATGDGGAINWFNRVESPNVNFNVIRGCSFVNNTANYNYGGGGAVYFDGEKYTATVEDCNFKDNSAPNGGAVYFLEGYDTATVSNCNFTDNKAGGDGGAIWMYSGSVENCNFADNSASRGGAILSVPYLGVTVDTCIFKTDSDTTFNTRNLPPTLNVDNFTTVYGSGEKLTFDLKTNSSIPVTNGNISISVYFKGNGEWVRNYTCLSGEGWIPDLPVGSYIAFFDTEYAEFQKINRTITITAPEHTFWFLDYTINGNGNPVIELSHDFYFDPAYDAAFVNGIVINRPVTIKGNGNAIDAKRQARIFYVQSANAVLENLTIINANYYISNGGAIYFSSSATSGTVSNCNFTNNAAFGDGGAVYFEDQGTVTNCNFTANQATTDGGAVFFNNYGNVTNCNFTGNTATGGGGAVYFYQGTGSVTNCNFVNNSATDGVSLGGAIMMDSGTVSNCNFTDNTASYGGAVRSIAGAVTNCNFVNNTASEEGGAIYFSNSATSGAVSNCNFADNTATYYGGAVYFNRNGKVTNCNFTGNNATNGSAIYFYRTSATKTVSNSRFLNNRANAEALDVVKNDNNITITFTGHNNLLNAIYSSEDAEVAFTNVKYWGANGITTVSARLSGSNKAAGQNITVGVVVNNELVLSDVMVTNESGMIVLDISAGENYYISARHNTDSYYTEAERTISNNINVNVTSKTTTNKTVNITAKSNIYSEVMPGKLLFILPNGTQIEATYGANGTWWAEHTFDAYGEYKVNATYVGLDNVTINNGTITINKVNSTITLDNIVLDYGETKNVTVTTTGATGITAKIDGNDVTVINNYTIQIPVLDAGTYNLTVTTIPDDDYNPVTKEVNITVNRVNSTLTVKDIVFDYGDSGSTVVFLAGADGVNATVVGQPKAVVKVNGTNITVSGLDAGTYTLTVTTIADKNHNNITKNATITVNKVNSTLTLDDVVLDYGETKNITVTTEGATGITAKIDGVNVTVNGYTIPISGLGAGNYTLTVTTIADKNHNPVTKEVNITVNKVESTLTVGDIVFDYDGEGSGDVSFTGASGVIANVINQPKAVVSVSGNKISVSGLGAGSYTLNVTTVPDENHTAVTETAGISVNKVNSTLTVNDVVLDYGETKNITVTTEGATGITAKIDGVDVTVSNYTIPISGLGAGNYTLTVTTIADKNHNPVTKEAKITVNKLSTEIILANETLDLKVGDEVTDLANLTPAGAGNLTLTSSDEDLVYIDDDGIVIGNGQGQAIITVSFAGNENYAAAENKTITVNVELNDASVSVENATLNLKVDETSAINATIEPDTIMLHIKYTSSDDSVATVDKNGIVTAVGEGRAIITLEVGDDEIYAKNSTTVTVTVSKINTTADVSIPENITVGDNSTVNVVLPADATGNVTVKVDGEVVDTVPVKDGNADVTIPSMSAGNHTVEIAYSGDGKYNPINETKDITVSKKDITPEITIPSDMRFGDNATVDVKLPGDASGNVTLTVDGEVADTVPVANGTASVKLPALDAGNHTAEIVYSGDDKYKSASKTATIAVNKDSTNIVADDVTATYKVDKYLVITLKDSDGNPLANASVTVDLNIIKNYTADENGQIKIKVSNLVPKTYDVKITFAGNNNYLGSDSTAKVVVKKATPKITAANKMFKTTTKNKKYAITLKDNTGKPIKNAKVYLKVNGKTYKATTNSKGKATFKITKLSKTGTFKATVTYKGNKYFNKASKKVTVKVISTWKTISKGSKAKSTVKDIQRALKNHGYYLTAYGHYLKVDGIYWDYTVKAVKQFQKAKGLKVTGKVDEKTAKKLGII